MDLIHFAIRNPVKVSVGVLLILQFGLISLFSIPIQLVPNVDQPVITVQTSWSGKDPQQIERDIVEEQEDKLKSVSGLRKMISGASRGRAEITLEFYIGTDMTRAMQEVSDSLREVPEYPEGVDEPVIAVADAASQNAIAWMVLTSADPQFDVESLRDQVEDRIKPFLERVEGISQVNVFGGRDRQVHIQVDPRRLAQRAITFNQFYDALRFDNVNVSAGEVQDGHLNVRIRTVGQFDDLETIRQTIITRTEGGPIRVRDVADVALTLEKRRSFVRSKGRPAIALNSIRRIGSNVIRTMEDLRERIGQVNAQILPHMGPDLSMVQVYDETVYIYDSRDLVVQNLWIGGLLAVAALLLFLRRLRPTLIVAMAIPVSVIGTFVAMTAAGRNLNVVLLAGLAFAVGIVVDNAIVVLENIDRHLAMGEAPHTAAYRGTREVWGAILASTLTTLAVFVPVIFMAEEAGQLFRDISLAICAAVTLSLIVAVTVIPSASARFARSHTAPGTRTGRALQSLCGLTSQIGRLRDRWADFIYALTERTPGRLTIRLTLVGALTAGSLVGIYLLVPPASYLPNGNRNLIFGIMLTPPAYTVQQNEKIARRIESELQPYWEAQTMAETAALSPLVDQQGRHLPAPPIENYFFVSWNGTIFMGAASKVKQVVRPLELLLNQQMNTNPGSMGFAFQPSIFGRGVGASNAIEIDVVGADMDRVRSAAEALFGVLFQMPRFSKIRPEPANFNIPSPELRARIKPVRAADLGVNVSRAGLVVEALIDGTIVGDFRIEGKSIDILLIRHPDMELRPDTLRMVPVSVRDESGQPTTVPLDSLLTIESGQAPQQIRRIEELRAVTLTVEPPPDVPLEAADKEIAAIVSQLRHTGAIAPDVDVRRTGTAAKLVQIRRSLLGEWTGLNLQTLQNLITSRIFLALLVVFLLMAALFESFLYPLVIMISVPLATIGGFFGLRIVHIVTAANPLVPTQQLDVLTMLGFVILIGVVVNNAILIVHQAINFMQGVAFDEKSDAVSTLTPRQAIRESVRTRLRPILMTTTTSVCGMLPLVLMPGAGSELYRGLGSVLVGGLVMATLFTLLAVPLMFSLVLDAQHAVQRLRR